MCESNKQCWMCGEELTEDEIAVNCDWMVWCAACADAYWEE